MAELGIIREIDPLGRITIPAEYRKALGMAKKSRVEIFGTTDALIIKRHTGCCTLCGKSVDNSDDKDTVCKECFEKPNNEQ